MRYLLLSGNDWATPMPGSVPQVAPAPLQPYPVDPVEAFVNSLLRSNQWRANPEYLLHRTVRLIKEIHAVGPLATTVPAILSTDRTPASTTDTLPALVTLGCNECEFVAKTKAGLAGHQRKHQAKV